MSELDASIRINLIGNLERRAQRYTHSIERFASRSDRALGRVARGSRALGRGLDRIGGRFTALIAGAAVAATAYGVISLQERLTRLGIAAEVSDSKLKQLHHRILAVAQMPNIRVDPGQILGAIETIVTKTGDLEFALANIKNIATEISATGATGQAIGGILAEFEKQGMKNPAQIARTMGTLAKQGKAGAFELADLAQLGPEVVTAYTALGRIGPKAMREMGAMIQVIRQSTGSAFEAATSWEALLRSFAQPRTLKALEAMHIQVFDPDLLKQGKEVLRPITDLVTEIIKKTRGHATLQTKIFPNVRALRALQALNAQYQQTGTLTLLDKFYQIQDDGSVIIADSARHARTAAAALTSLKTAWRQFSNANLAGPLQSAADALGHFDAQSKQTALNIAKYGALALGGLFLGKKLGLGKLLGAGARRVFRRSGLGGAGARAASRLGAQPVYVVNMPGGGMLGQGLRRGSPLDAELARQKRGSVRGFAALGRGGTRLGSRFVGLAGKTARLTGALGLAATAGYALGTLIEKQLEGTKVGDDIGRGITSMLGRFGVDEARASVIRNQLGGPLSPTRVAMRKNDVAGAFVRGLGFVSMKEISALREQTWHGNLDIHVEDDRVRVKTLSSASPNVTLNVGYAGSMP